MSDQREREEQIIGVIASDDRAVYRIYDPGHWSSTSTRWFWLFEIGIRHGRACPGHPRFHFLPNTWMRGTPARLSASSTRFCPRMTSSCWPN